MFSQRLFVHAGSVMANYRTNVAFFYK